MIAAVMQPSYLPWAGYFNLISGSNLFVFLDDAQLQKNSWHNRNRILVNRSPFWITVPVKRKSLSQSINGSMIDKSKNWNQKHIKLLHHTYSKHPFSKEALEVCSVLEQGDFINLADLNIRLIKWFMHKLDIRTKIYLSSELSIEGNRTERLVDILEDLKAKQYLSPVGAAEYLNLDGFEEQTEIALKFQDYSPKPYPQSRQDDFVSHLSIVDVVANIGWKAARQYII